MQRDVLLVGFVTSIVVLEVMLGNPVSSVLTGNPEICVNLQPDNDRNV